MKNFVDMQLVIKMFFPNIWSVTRFITSLPLIERQLLLHAMMMSKKQSSQYS